jgi:hypothetical protein
MQGSSALGVDQEFETAATKHGDKGEQRSPTGDELFPVS